MKKVLTSLIVVVMVIAVVCGCVACSTQDPQEAVIDCAKYLQNKWGGTFEIAGDCGYRKNYTFEGTTYMNTYIGIPFEVKNEETGEVIIRDIAYFVNGSFAGYESNYEDDSYKEWSDNSQLHFLLASLIYIESDFTEVFTKEQVNSALGIGVSSGEVGSGTVSGEETDAE